MTKKLLMDSNFQKKRPFLLSETEESSLKSTFKNLAISSSKFWETRQETTSTCLKENALSREEIKRSLRKLLRRSWMQQPDIRWVYKHFS